MRLLIIEDEAAVAAFVKQGLEEDGFQVDVARSGPEGEARALAEPYDLVILDLMLPGKDGLEVLDALRRAQMQAPILILSARDTLEDKLGGFDHGADDYLTKPFAFVELLARVQALLRRRPQIDPIRLTVGALTLDRVRRVVRRGDQERELTNRECALLTCFMLQPGMTLSRATLAEQIWGPDFDPGSNVIDVIVSHVRNKVDRGFPTTLICTVRGLGYQLRFEEQERT